MPSNLLNDVSINSINLHRKTDKSTNIISSCPWQSRNRAIKIQQLVLLQTSRKKYLNKKYHVHKTQISLHKVYKSDQNYVFFSL